MTTDKPSRAAEALPASTIILLRDVPATDSFEVLMMERRKTVGFAAGMVVFPGGKVDEADLDPDLVARCRGGTSDDPLLAFRVAVLRELFEEAGILLAEDREGQPIDNATRTRLIEDFRAPLLADEIGFATIAAEADLYFAPQDLAHFAHWITPEVAPRRFDTHFFAIRAPAEQHAILPGGEAVEMAWCRPGDMLAKAKAGETALMFPTLLNMQLLAGAADTATALAAAEARDVVTVMPKIVVEESDIFLEIPDEAGYGRTRYHQSEVPEALGRPRSRKD